MWRTYALYAKFSTKFKAKSPHKAQSCQYLHSNFLNMKKSLGSYRTLCDQNCYIFRYIRDNQAHFRFVCQIPNKIQSKIATQSAILPISSQFILRTFGDNQAHFRFVCQILNKIQSKIATQSIYKAQSCQYLHNSYYVHLVTIRRIFALYAKFPTKFKAKSPHKAQSCLNFTLRHIRDNHALYIKIQSSSSQTTIYWRVFGFFSIEKGEGSTLLSSLIDIQAKDTLMASKTISTIISTIN